MSRELIGDEATAGVVARGLTLPGSTLPGTTLPARTLPAGTPGAGTTALVAADLDAPAEPTASPEVATGGPGLPREPAGGLGPLPPRPAPRTLLAVAVSVVVTAVVVGLGALVSFQQLQPTAAGQKARLLVGVQMTPGYNPVSPGDGVGDGVSSLDSQLAVQVRVDVTGQGLAEAFGDGTTVELVELKAGKARVQLTPTAVLVAGSDRVYRDLHATSYFFCPAGGFQSMDAVLQDAATHVVATVRVGGSTRTLPVSMLGETWPMFLGPCG